MLWIGLTGSMGSGKSTVATILRGIGYSVVDADKTVHLILSPGGAGETEIFRTFGGEAGGGDLRGPDGHLDRRALGRIVFGDRAKLTRLEALLHPLVRDSVRAERARLASAGHGAAFYDVPLLFEKKMEADFDFVLVVDAPADQRRARLAKRSQMTEAEFLERSKQQVAPEEKVARASYVIQNDGDFASLERAVHAAVAALNLPPPA